MIQHRGPYQSQLDVRREGDGRGLDIADLAQNSGVCSPCSPSSGDKLVAYDTYDNAVLTYLRGFKQITKPEGNKLDIERTKTRVKARKQLSPVSRHAMMVNYPPEARHKLTYDPFAPPDPLEDYRVGSCGCEQARIEAKGLAKPGGTPNRSFWNFDRLLDGTNSNDTQAEAAVARAEQDRLRGTPKVGHDPPNQRQ